MDEFELEQEFIRLAPGLEGWGTRHPYGRPKSGNHIRHVRTPEGARYYDQPIGSIITRDTINRINREKGRLGLKPPKGALTGQHHTAGSANHKDMNTPGMPKTPAEQQALRAKLQQNAPKPGALAKRVAAGPKAPAGQQAARPVPGSVPPKAAPTKPPAGKPMPSAPAGKAPTAKPLPGSAKAPGKPKAPSAPGTTPQQPPRDLTPEVKQVKPTINGPLTFKVAGKEYGAPEGSKIFRLNNNPEALAFVRTPDGNIKVFNKGGEVTVPQDVHAVLQKRFAGNLKDDANYHLDTFDNEGKVPELGDAKAGAALHEGEDAVFHRTENGSWKHATLGTEHKDAEVSGAYKAGELTYKPAGGADLTSMDREGFSKAIRAMPEGKTLQFANPATGEVKTLKKAAGAWGTDDGKPMSEASMFYLRKHLSGEDNPDVQKKVAKATKDAVKPKTPAKKPAAAAKKPAAAPAAKKTTAAVSKPAAAAKPAPTAKSNEPVKLPSAKALKDAQKAGDAKAARATKDMEAATARVKANGGEAPKKDKQLLRSSAPFRDATGAQTRWATKKEAADDEKRANGELPEYDGHGTVTFEDAKPKAQKPKADPEPKAATPVDEYARSPLSEEEKKLPTNAHPSVADKHPMDLKPGDPFPGGTVERVEPDRKHPDFLTRVFVKYDHDGKIGEVGLENRRTVGESFLDHSGGKSIIDTKSGVRKPEAPKADEPKAEAPHVEKPAEKAVEHDPYKAFDALKKGDQITHRDQLQTATWGTEIGLRRDHEPGDEESGLEEIKGGEDIWRRVSESHWQHVGSERGEHDARTEDGEPVLMKHERFIRYAVHQDGLLLKRGTTHAEPQPEKADGPKEDTPPVEKATKEFHELQPGDELTAEHLNALPAGSIIKRRNDRDPSTDQTLTRVESGQGKGLYRIWPKDPNSKRKPQLVGTSILTNEGTHTFLHSTPEPLKPLEKKVARAAKPEVKAAHKPFAELKKGDILERPEQIDEAPIGQTIHHKHWESGDESGHMTRVSKDEWHSASGNGKVIVPHTMVRKLAHPYGSQNHVVGDGPAKEPDGTPDVPRADHPVERALQEGDPIPSTDWIRDAAVDTKVAYVKKTGERSVYTRISAQEWESPRGTRVPASHMEEPKKLGLWRFVSIPDAPRPLVGTNGADKGTGTLTRAWFESQPDGTQVVVNGVTYLKRAGKWTSKDGNAHGPGDMVNLTTKK